MSVEDNNQLVIAAKDSENERKIPSLWRPVIRRIVSALVKHDYQVNDDIPGLVPIATKTALQIERFIQNYGATLIELPDETWESSVCIWVENHWEALVDLWTLSEGRSDIVLHLFVSESHGYFSFNIHMVYVP